MTFFVTSLKALTFENACANRAFAGGTGLFFSLKENLLTVFELPKLVKEQTLFDWCILFCS